MDKQNPLIEARAIADKLKTEGYNHVVRFDINKIRANYNCSAAVARLVICFAEVDLTHASLISQELIEDDGAAEPPSTFDKSIV